MHVQFLLLFHVEIYLNTSIAGEIRYTIQSELFFVYFVYFLFLCCNLVMLYLQYASQYVV